MLIKALSLIDKCRYTDEILVTDGPVAPNPCYVAQIPISFHNHIITFF